MNSSQHLIEGISFNKDDLQVLTSCILFAVRHEANYSDSTGIRKRAWSMLKTEEDRMVDKMMYRGCKLAWINQWEESTLESLGIERALGKKEIEERLAKIKGNKKKRTALAVEIATFAPYFSLGKDSSLEEGLRFDGDDKKRYLSKAGDIIGIRYSDILNSSRRFSKCIDGMSRIIAGKSHSWTLLGIGLLIATLLIDPIAGGIGAAMELSGGAALLAGLAFLGGGAIASGGLGITGGLLVIMAGGAILGYGAGSLEYDNRLKSCSKEQLFLYCGKLYAFACIAEVTQQEKEYICAQALSLQNQYEADADKAGIQCKTDQCDEFEEKLKVLNAFRKYFRLNPT